MQETKGRYFKDRKGDVESMTNGEKIIRQLMDEGIESVLFLPYNASMADSMVSVVGSAKRLGLKVHVYPLSFTSCGVERNEFVEGEIEKPNIEDFDAVVYHNPYDDSNFVTEVEKEFHSDKMKGKTTLVYIPYYCGISNMDFMTKPGVRNADIIFCDPEDELDYQMLYPDKKIFGVESPKMDTIEEGTGNAILICTSLIPFLEKSGSKIAAYRGWINDMEGEEIIFRPHPLMRETIETLAPTKLEEWDKLIEEVKAKGIEIDTEPQIGKTFARCKLLVSDGSSVVKMWEKTEKPCFLID